MLANGGQDVLATPTSSSLIGVSRAFMLPMRVNVLHRGQTAEQEEMGYLHSLLLSFLKTSGWALEDRI